MTAHLFVHFQDRLQLNMTNPIGYYCNHIPGDGSILDKLETKYGSHLQSLNTREKIFLVKRLGYQICNDMGNEAIRLEELTHQLELLKVLPTGDKLGLIRCLVDGVNV